MLPQREYRTAIAVLLLCAGWAAAQNVSSSLSATVQDPAGAAVSDAEVKLVSEGTGFQQLTKTNSEGFFSLPYVTPGTYSITISAAGFMNYTQSPIAVSAAERRSLGIIVLQVGAITTSITVTAEINPVSLASGDRAGVLTGEEIAGMALRGRDFADAVGLLPGIVDAQDSREAPGADSFNNIYMAGSLRSSKNVTIDGTTVLDTGSNGAVHTMPSMDAIGEVKVLMSNYSAEHGRNSGGQITVITKGGGQRFHGTAGWYYRHESLSANDYFNNRSGLERAPYRYNIASYTISGPLLIPKVFTKERRRVFFFFSQEFQRQRKNFGRRTVTVPTELERAGDFSQSYDVNGRPRTIYDPLVGRTPFPGNRIPASRIDPVGRNILNLFPLPNFVDPEPSRQYQWNYISDRSGPYPRRTEIVRLDFSPHHALQMYTRLSNTDERQEVPYGFPAGSINFPLTPIDYVRPGRGLTLNTIATLSPTVTNELSVGVSWSKMWAGPLYPERVRRQETGINVPQWYPSVNPGGLIPNMTFGGVANAANPSMYNPTPLYGSNRIISVANNFSKVTGSHALKLGVYLEYTRKNEVSTTQARGNLVFTADASNPVDTNYAYANALVGSFRSYQQSNANPLGEIRFKNVEWYVSDVWKVGRSLSLDYGVRFYRDLPHYSIGNQLASFAPWRYDRAKAPTLLRPALNSQSRKVAIDPLTGKEYPALMIGAFVPGVGDTANGMMVGGLNGVPESMYTTRGLSVAPRFGFAWDPFGRQRTAIRGGGGVFYDRIPDAFIMASLLASPPKVYSPTVYYGTFADLQGSVEGAMLAPTNATALYGRQPQPISYGYSLGLQQQVGKTILLDAAYVGTLSRHLPWTRNINPVPLHARFVDQHPENADPTNTKTALAANFLRPYYPGFADINAVEFAATTNYHSLQVSANRKMANGFMVSGAYTFSKTLGTIPYVGSPVSTFLPPRDRNYGPTAFDRTHILSFRYNWRIPVPGKGLRQSPVGLVLRDWELAGITRLSTGAPFTPSFTTVDGQDISGTPTEAARPNIADLQGAAVNRFGRPARGTLGNAGVGVLRQPGRNNWDMSLYRRIPLGESRLLRLRFETYNTFNHTQFSAVSATARFDANGSQIDPLFLQPTTAYSPRRVQLAVSLSW